MGFLWIWGHRSPLPMNARLQVDQSRPYVDAAIQGQSHTVEESHNGMKLLRLSMTKPRLLSCCLEAWMEMKAMMEAKASRAAPQKSRSAKRHRDSKASLRSTKMRILREIDTTRGPQRKHPS